MKIKNIDTRPTSLTLRQFASINVGEVFRAKDSRNHDVIAIRIEYVYDDDYEPIADAVNLANGDRIYIYNNAEVELYTGEVEFDEAKFDKWNR